MFKLIVGGAIFLGLVTSSLAWAAERKEGSIPARGVIVTATAGDSLFERYSYAIDQVAEYYVDTRVVSKGFGWEADIPAGTMFTAVGGARARITCTETLSSNNIPSFGVKLPSCLYDDDLDGRFDRVSQRGGMSRKLPPTPYRTVSKDVVVAGDGFKTVFLFNGFARGILRISYREFTNDMARPAFTQDLEFELGVEFPQDITVKGTRFIIYSADQNGVRYEVAP